MRLVRFCPVARRVSRRERPPHEIVFLGAFHPVAHCLCWSGNLRCRLLTNAAPWSEKENIPDAASPASPGASSIRALDTNMDSGAVRACKSKKFYELSTVPSGGFTSGPPARRRR
jgi:hypothetical protein